MTNNNSYAFYSLKYPILYYSSVKNGKLYGNFILAWNKTLRWMSWFRISSPKSQIIAIWNEIYSLN